MFDIQGLHHHAYRCRDAAETRAFYEDVLGLPLVHVLVNERVPSTGEPTPHAHIFFRMGDGSLLAFFDLGDGTAALPSPNTPNWVQHLALRLPTVEQVRDAKTALEAKGIEVVGVTDHGFVQSIYFFDPNGLRLELTAEPEAESQAERYRADASANLAAWMTRRRAALLDDRA